MNELIKFTFDVDKAIEDDFTEKINHIDEPKFIVGKSTILTESEKRLSNLISKLLDETETKV